MKKNWNWLWLVIGVLVAFLLLMPIEGSFTHLTKSEKEVSLTQKFSHHFADQLTNVVSRQVNHMVNAE